MPGVTPLSRSSVDRRPLPPCTLLFSFKTKQKLKQGIQRMFFLPTKEISGASSKTLTSAPGLAAMCSISHRLSSVTGKCTITSWPAAGEQLGVGSAPTTLCAGARGRARAKAKSKGGFLYRWFGVFWMHIEGEFYACMSFFVQGCLEAGVLLLCSVSMNKMCLGRYVATWSVLQ